MSDCSKNNTVGSIMGFLAVCAVLGTMAFFAWVLLKCLETDTNSYTNTGNRTDERLERIEQKIEILNNELQDIKNELEQND